MAVKGALSRQEEELGANANSFPRSVRTKGRAQNIYEKARTSLPVLQGVRSYRHWATQVQAFSVSCLAAVHTYQPLNRSNSFRRSVLTPTICLVYIAHWYLCHSGARDQDGRLKIWAVMSSSPPRDALLRAALSANELDPTCLPLPKYWDECLGVS